MLLLCSRIPSDSLGDRLPTTSSPLEDEAPHLARTQVGSWLRNLFHRHAAFQPADELILDDAAWWELEGKSTLAVGRSVRAPFTSKVYLLYVRRLALRAQSIRMSRDK